MKKFIQVCSLLSLLVLFGGVSANAQSGFGTEVDIPFAFNVGDHAYEAGNYILKIDKLATGTATLSIRDTNTDDVQVVILNGNGDAPASEVKLVFDAVDGRRYLTKVRTPDRSYALIRSKAEKNAAKSRTSGAPAIGGSANLF